MVKKKGQMDRQHNGEKEKGQMDRQLLFDSRHHNSYGYHVSQMTMNMFLLL
jgi:hypothetical protein